MEHAMGRPSWTATDASIGDTSLRENTKRLQRQSDEYHAQLPRAAHLQQRSRSAQVTLSTSNVTAPSVLGLHKQQ